MPPTPTTLSQRITRLAEYGMTLIHALHTTTHPTLATVTQFARIARAIRWALALAALIRGEYHLPPARNKSQPNQPQPQPRRTPTPRRPRAVDSAMHHAFRTLTIGQIVAKLCADLGITPDHPDFPADLTEISQTPTQTQASPRGSAPGPRQGQGSLDPFHKKSSANIYRQRLLASTCMPSAPVD
jgi:hypothetical protein